MKQILLLFISVSVFSNSLDTLKLENGRNVELFDDFTWRYIKLASNENKEESKVVKLYKQLEHNETVKSKEFPYSISFNNSKFEYKKERGNKEFLFKSIDNTMFMQTIAEENYLTLDLLSEAAIVNARNADKNLKVISKEKAIINGKNAVLLEMQAKVQNYEFTYYGCYVSEEGKGSFQLLTWTYTSMFEKKKEDLRKLISGFQVN